MFETPQNLERRSQRDQNHSISHSHEGFSGITNEETLLYIKTYSIW